MIPTVTIFFDTANRLKVIQLEDGRYDCALSSAVEGNLLGEYTFNGIQQIIHIAIEEVTTPEASFLTWDELSRVGISESLEALMQLLEPELIKIAYLKFNERAYIYRFRNLKERNTDVYKKSSRALYQSQLCAAIKLIRREKEKISEAPVILNFGPVQYVLPSHFGFCLGVQNAIERAYETIANHPGQSIYMLSELIHNPFVNADLNRRGLRYLQSNKGEWLTTSGEITSNKKDKKALWNQIKINDIVIIPAFGATQSDKLRLIKKGIQLKDFDATCMLVEKVWKAIKAHADQGYTTIIHGKYYHEETKATFSNAIDYGPSLIISDMKEARLLSEIIEAEPDKKRALFEQYFSGRYSEGFDPSKDLEKIAVVNQTTLLRNHTLSIIEHLKEVLSKKHGDAALKNHLWINEKGDTLCYATQVNQDALHKAVEKEIDIALVLGGKNSSNTYQLYQICAQNYKTNAHYIQSEANIKSRDTIEHYVYSKDYDTAAETRPFLPLPGSQEPLKILITGGASCPDGIVQQVITKINSFFPEDSLKPIEAVIESLNQQ